MKFSEIQEACWKGYQQQGMKKKGNRQVPNCVPVEESTGDPFIDNAARELLAMVLMFGVPFVAGVYIDLRNKLRKYQGKEIIDALERKGVTMNRQTYDKVKPVLDRFDQAIRDNEGAEARALAKQIEQMIIMGKLSAPEPKAPDSALAAKEKELAEDLRKWFKEKWVRFGPDGKIRGDCARGSEKEGKPKCLPQSKAHALGKKGRASAAAKKRREDPNPERRGPAKNVATRVREQGVTESSVDNNAKLSWVAKKLASETVIPGDRKDFLKAAKRFDRGYTTGGMDIINDMDTDPRDDFFNYCDHYGAVYEQDVAEGYSNTTFNFDRRKLNVPALIQKGAIFVTYPHGEQGWETNNKEDWAFSLLSLYNVLQGGWPSEAKKYLKPESYRRAEQQINSSAPNLGSGRLVYDGKYNQILWSIKKLGIPDNVAFLDKGQQGVAEMDKSQKSQERHGDYPLGAKGTAVKPVPAKKVVKDLARDLDKAFAKEKKVKEDANPKFAALIKNIQARLKKDDYQRPEIVKRVAQMVQQADPTVTDAMATARELVQQYGQGPVEKQTNVWDLKAQARSGNLAAQLPKTSAGTPSYAQQHATFEAQSTNNDNWYDDADEFGMPGSEFFSDDDRLRDGDYVRDRQDGEYGEIFRMSGDPTERRVRILDRDGRGWYISPERLEPVDRTDPDIMRYFGRRRHRDMDEATGDSKFDTMMGRIVDPVAALKQDRVYEEQLEDYVFEFMNEFLTRMDRLGIEVWRDHPRAGEDLTNPKFEQAYEQASLKAVQKFMQRKKLDTNNQRLVAQVKADFDENADQVNPVAGFLGNFMQGFTTLRPGEIDIMSKAGMFKKPGEDVAEAFGLYGPFTVTIRTGERPESRTKTKKFKREDDAILWAEDWLEDAPQYVFATAEVTDPDGNIVWTTDEQGLAEGFEYGNRVQHPKYGAGQVIQVYSNGVITVNFPNYPDPIDKKPGVRSNFAPGDKDYQSLKPMVSEKQDACYRKVKSRYKVWPSAYASGALVQCRKKGAANWGNKKK